VAGGPHLPDDRFADLGGPVHYVEWDGPPGRTFVLLHGLGGSYLQWLVAGPELARLGRVVAIDLDQSFEEICKTAGA
jgi:pimeloyl-ACP methyl ester carboxylesterase